MRARRRGHPFLFVWVVFVLAGALGIGAWALAIGAAALAAWLVVR